MEEKLWLPGELSIKQDSWQESPCHNCSESPCCKNLPLLPHRLENQADYINLALSSCYNGVFPALKESGEWTVYLGRTCQFLDRTMGKCNIHNTDRQSMICKSYDAHRCWYVQAFSRERYTNMIPFNTDMIIWFEKRYGLIANRFDVERNWDEICEAAYEFNKPSVDLDSEVFEPLESHRLPFRKSRSDQFLFFPPYEKPQNRKHFELLTFRLGFPGVYLAVSDNCWSFLVKTTLNQSRLALLQQEYYPTLKHSDSRFSLSALEKEHHPFSGIGEQWIVLSLSELDILKGLTRFSSTGLVQKLPSCAEILAALKSQHPDRRV